MNIQADLSMRSFLTAFLLLGLVFVCYANTLNAPWYFDDLIRIVNNRAVHLNELTPAALKASLDPAAGESHSQSAFFRPVAMASFALNWLFSGSDTTGFHLVNIAIHFLTAFVLYQTILVLMRAPQVPNDLAAQAHCSALLASVLWAIHPIQTQAVTYIVQRTTSLAGLFFVAGMWGYLKARTAHQPRQRLFFFIGAGFFYLLGMGTKLNTAILPLSWMLVDILFFQDLNDREQRHKIFRRLTMAGLAAVVLGMGLLWMMTGDPLAPIIKGYDQRPFTLPQRLMTEPRIILFYLSLLCMPIPDRFGFMHDVTISRSLMDPWTTLPAMASIVLLVGIGLYVARRNKFLSLAILFFFLNHLVESSIVPLELLYEHRNYLPSMFLFLPLVIPIVAGIARWRSSRRYLSGGMAVGVIILMVMLGTATHARNRVWTSEKIFWEDVLVKASGSARPYMQLGAYHEKQGRYALALKLYARALDLYDPAPQRVRSGAYNNMGTIFNRWRQKEAAIRHFQEALAVNPRHEIARYNLLFPLISVGRLDEALNHAEVLIRQNPAHPYYLNSAGYILLQQGQLDRAREQLEKALAITPSSIDILINLGITLGRAGRFSEAIALLEHARRLAPVQPTAVLSLIEVHILAGNDTAADEVADQLIRQIPLDFYYTRLAGPADGLTSYDTDIIRPILARRLRDFNMAAIDKLW